MKSKLMPLKEWNRLGFRVRKGSRAVKYSLGQSLFSFDQVYRPGDSSYYRGSGSTSSVGYEYEYEGSWEEIIGDPDFYH